jgi:CHAT domain-containing protein
MRVVIEQLLALPDEPARRTFLETHAATLTEAEANDLADALKAQADHYLRAELAACWQFTHLLFYLAELRGDEFIRALALRAEGNALSIGQAHFREAIEKYDEAAAIYRAQGRELDEAKSQIGKVFALTNLGRYDEAIRVGEWVAEILAKYPERLLLADTLVNLGIAYGKQNNESEALSQFEKALGYCDSSDVSDKAFIDWNRSEALRNLGRLDEAILAGESALAGFTQAQQPAASAAAMRSIAESFFVVGRYNDSIKYLESARPVFELDGRIEDVAITDWLISDSLLITQKFLAVINKCKWASKIFLSCGETFEAAQVMLNEAGAYSGLRQYTESITTLQQARALFEQEPNSVWTSVTDLNIASVLNQMGQHHNAFELSQKSVNIFKDRELPLRLAQAHLIAAQAAQAQNHYDFALDHAHNALNIAQALDSSWLSYNVYLVLAKLSRSRGATADASYALNAAIAHYEQLRGNWMIEHRADFAQGKQAPYTEVAEICFSQNDASGALEYIERAKSRALIDMLAYRVDLSVHPRHREDEFAVQELNRLRAQRNQLARRFEVASREARLRPGQNLVSQIEQTQQLHQLEQAITEQWHSLLVRNADYARDASLWQVQVEPVQEQLQPGQALVEYAELNGGWVAFVVTTQGVTAHALPINPAQTQSLLRNLWLNFKTVANTPQALKAGQPNNHAASLRSNAQELLRRLHAGLMQPIAAALATAEHVFVVPHGALHYLPFQALFDGARGAYWIESSAQTLSYLPCASVLKYCRRASKPLFQRGGVGAGFAVAFGHSRHAQLLHAPHEAQQVAVALGGTAFTEADATLNRFQEVASEADIIHLAMHGDFRADAPLFSGLHFEDGMLTTLDTYNLRLKASLVALSACQTGRGVLGGGDELLGLMRGFLGAGAASLLLSLWRVEDRSTLALMEHFYNALAQGQTKAAALHHAQCSVMQQLPHPYFWAPFVLVGDAGPV